MLANVRLLTIPSYSTIQAFLGANPLPGRPGWLYGEVYLQRQVGGPPLIALGPDSISVLRGYGQPEKACVIVDMNDYPNDLNDMFRVSVIAHEHDGTCHQWEIRLGDQYAAEILGECLMCGKQWISSQLEALGFKYSIC